MNEEIIEQPKFSGKLETILPNGKVIYDGVVGFPSQFPLTESEKQEILNNN